MEHKYSHLILLSNVWLLAGCMVFQPQGLGQEMYLRANKTSYTYWLYMPVNHKSYKKMSTVISLHGIKPFDNSHAQCREWQQQADIYGFVIVAPDLTSSNFFAPSPLKTITPDVEHDGRAIIGILKDLAYNDWFDSNAVLITSWSYGGYIAHWVANEYPDYFTCLAVRQSNFNGSILNPSKLSRYRYKKIGIFSTANDFLRCRIESKEAAEWYSRYGFDVTYLVLNNRGHERIPDPVAIFFVENK